MPSFKRCKSVTLRFLSIGNRRHLGREKEDESMREEPLLKLDQA
jgi:hypothetical protein